MDSHNALYVLLLLGSSALTASLAAFAWHRRSAPGALPFGVSAIASCINSGFLALEIMSPGLWAKGFLTNIEYVGMVTLPITWLLMAVQYAGLGRWITRRRIVALSVLPAITILLLWTNDLHHLMRFGVYLDTTGLFPTIGKTYGLWFWVQAIYSYVLSAASGAVLVRARLSANATLGRQPSVLLVALLLPIAANLLYVLKLNPMSRADLTPIMCGISGLLIAWSLFRHRLFDIVPMAHTRVVHNLGDGLIVLDAQGRIAEVNPAARRIICLPDGGIGEPGAVALAGYPGLAALALDSCAPPLEIELGQGLGQGTNCHFDARVWPLTEPRHGNIGSVILLHDITKRKLLEEQLIHLASHDSLTGLPNRRSLEEMLARAVGQARRGHTSTLLYLDVDNFKLVNDYLGHAEGDRTLIQVTRLLQSCLRSGDFLARHGGDEFGVILDRASVEDALLVAERMRHLVRRLEFPGQGQLLGLSAGVTAVDGRLSAWELLVRVDDGLYRAKSQGRDQAVVAEPAMMPSL